MARETAKKDDNYVNTLMGVDMTTGLLPTKVYVDEVTHRLLVSAVITSASTYKVKWDKTVTNVIYLGKAVLGSSLSSAVWQIQKIDKTVTNTGTITFANAGAFTATWDNRLTETYT